MALKFVQHDKFLGDMKTKLSPSSLKMFFTFFFQKRKSYHNNTNPTNKQQTTYYMQSYDINIFSF